MTSLLLSEGHPNARRYPVAMVWREAEICRARLNNRHVTESLLMQACIGGILGGKKGSDVYAKMIKDLNRG